MDRDEALEFLRNELKFLRVSGINPPDGWLKEFEAAITALSSPCACRGREPVAKGWACGAMMQAYREGVVAFFCIYHAQSAGDDTSVIVLPADEGIKE